MLHLDQTSLSCCYHPETGSIFTQQSHGVAKDFIKRHCPGPIPVPLSPATAYPQTHPTGSEQGECAPATHPHGPAQPATGQGHRVTHTNAMSPNTAVGIRRLCTAFFARPKHFKEPWGSLSTVRTTPAGPTEPKKPSASVLPDRTGHCCRRDGGWPR